MLMMENQQRFTQPMELVLQQTSSEQSDVLSGLIIDSGSISPIHVQDFFNPDQIEEFKPKAFNLKDLMIVRQTSVPKQVEIIGNLRTGHNPYREYLSAFSCYDLAPQSGVVTVFDPIVKICDVFPAVWKQPDHVGLVYDSLRHEYTALIVEVDFLRMVQRAYDRQDLKLTEHPIGWWTDVSDAQHAKHALQMSTHADESVLQATERMVTSKLHAVPVTTSSNNSVLYFLSLARIMKFIKKQSRSIPIPPWMLQSVGDAKVGTFIKMQWVTSATPLTEAVRLMVSFQLVCLPVLLDDQLVEVLNVADLVYCALHSVVPKDTDIQYDKKNMKTAPQANEHVLDIHTKTVADALALRSEARSRVLHIGQLCCRASDTIVSVIDKLVDAETSSIYVIDENRSCIGVVSYSDMLSYILQPHGDDPMNGVLDEGEELDEDIDDSQICSSSGLTIQKPLHRLDPRQRPNSNCYNYNYNYNHNQHNLSQVQISIPHVRPVDRQGRRDSVNLPIRVDMDKIRQMIHSVRK